MALNTSCPPPNTRLLLNGPGHNRKLGEYFLAPGYPAYDPHPRYLGELHGSWSQIGRQYGERAGDLIRLVYEGWYRELLPIQGSSEIIAAYLIQQERYYEPLVPKRWK